MRCRVAGAHTLPAVAVNASLGALGVAVDDGMGCGDGAAAAQTPGHVAQALQASGRFTLAALNRFDLPPPRGVKIRKKPSSSEEARRRQSHRHCSDLVPAADAAVE